MRLFNKIILMFFMLGLALLTGCASLSPPSNYQTINWDTRAQTLTALQQWDANGAIAIRTPHDGWSASWQWQQRGQDYTILLFGPLGAGSIKLSGNPQTVTLETANGQHFRARAPEVLLAQQLGWRLPVSSLYYWIRGLPAPALPAQKQLDRYQHLSRLLQDGWIIEYLRYTPLQQMDMPEKIVLINPQLNVKIIIHQWQVFR